MSLRVSLVVLGLASGQAWAENAEAEALFRSGRQLMEEGNFASACAAFEKSNELEANTNTLLNVADCQEKNKKYATAWRAFVEAAEKTKGKDQALNDVANERAKGLEPKLSYAQIAVPPKLAANDKATIAIDGKPLSKSFWNTPVAIDNGHHELVAKAPGFADQTRTVDITADATRATVTFDELAGADDARGGGKSPMRSRLFVGAMAGRESMAAAEDGNVVGGIDAGYQLRISGNVFARFAGGVHYQHMDLGSPNAVAFQVGPSIGYAIADVVTVSWEPTLGFSSAGNQEFEGTDVKSDAGPYLEALTFSVGYLQNGTFEYGVTFNIDELVGHHDTYKINAAFRYHL